jgi:predicted dehydrogenase
VTVHLGICSVAHFHAAAYADLLSGLDGVEFVGVVDEEAERGRAFADDNGTWFRSRAELLSRADGVVVCSANADRRPWIEAAADAGVDLLSEKPLGTTADEARELAEICDAADVELSVAMPLRHSVPAQQARERLDRVGDLTALSGANRGHFPGGWFADPEHSGGGAVMDHTVHIVDLVHWLTGQRVAEVYAETDTRFSDAVVEDVNVLSMALEDGTPFLLDGSWSKPDAWESWGDAFLEVTGTEGVVELDCFAQRYRVTREADPAGVSSTFYGSDPNRRMLERFAETVRGAAPATPGQDAVAALAVVDAAYESAECGEPVAVEY